MGFHLYGRRFSGDGIISFPPGDIIIASFFGLEVERSTLYVEVPGSSLTFRDSFLAFFSCLGFSFFCFQPVAVEYGQTK